MKSFFEWVKEKGLDESTWSRTLGDKSASGFGELDNEPSDDDKAPRKEKIVAPSNRGLRPDKALRVDPKRLDQLTAADDRRRGK